MTGRAEAKLKRSASASLPKPKPLTAYESQWPEPVLPATRQTPEYVPLGTSSGGDRIDLALSTDVGGTIALSDGESFGRASLRARLHAEPFAQPVSFDVGVGRLDGLRVRSPSWGGFTIGAFGGTVPDPLDYLPTLDTTRFGAELAYQNESLDAQPFVGLSVHASTFMGDIDERRLNLEFDVFPGTGHVAGHIELSMHDEVNPWQAPRFEVSAAGLDASIRVGIFQLAGRFDMRLPERSLWLTSYLPLGYLCNTVPDPAASTGDEVVCLNSNDQRYFGGLDASFSFSRFALHAGANIVHSETAAEFEQISGYLQARILRIADIAWADVSVAAYARSFVSDYAARLGAGVDIRRIGEISAYYRVSLNQYVASPTNWLQHSAGGILYFALGHDLDLGVRVDGIFGEDVSVLVLGSNLTWRPSW